MIRSGVMARVKAVTGQVCRPLPCGRGGARAALILLCLTVLHGEIIDRIAVAVGKQVITSSQIDTEERVTAFLNGSGADADAVAVRKKAAGRLIDQTLIRREIELTRFPVPRPEEAVPLLEQAKAVHGDGYANAL